MAVRAKGKACAEVLRLERGPNAQERGQGESGNKGRAPGEVVVAGL